MAFDLQGHRGARGLKPENTLPSFEVAIDCGVTSIETDVHLSRDDVPVLSHDAHLNERLCRSAPGLHAIAPARQPLIRSLTLAELRCYRADRNPDPVRFPDQDAEVTPVVRLFAEQRGLGPYALPTLADLFAMVAEYASELGAKAGKSERQRQTARQLRFDLELKRLPFRPEYIGDGFDGTAPGLLEQRIAEAARAAGVIERTTVRSFCHRSVKVLRELESRLMGAVLLSGTAPVDPVQLVRSADAQIYCPECEFLDPLQVRQLHAEGIQVLPWTVNDPEDWKKLLGWGVDGITTDFPDRLARFLAERQVG